MSARIYKVTAPSRPSRLGELEDEETLEGSQQPTVEEWGGLGAGQSAVQISCASHTVVYRVGSRIVVQHKGLNIQLSPDVSDAIAFEDAILYTSRDAEGNLRVTQKFGDDLQYIIVLHHTKGNVELAKIAGNYGVLSVDDEHTLFTISGRTYTPILTDSEPILWAFEYDQPNFLYAERAGHGGFSGIMIYGTPTGTHVSYDHADADLTAADVDPYRETFKGAEVAKVDDITLEVGGIVDSISEISGTVHYAAMLSSEDDSYLDDLPALILLVSSDVGVYIIKSGRVEKIEDRVSALASDGQRIAFLSSAGNLVIANNVDDNEPQSIQLAEDETVRDIDFCFNENEVVIYYIS